MTAENQCETLLRDHIEQAIDRMKQGARMILDAIPGDSSLSSSSFGPKVTAEIARRLDADDAFTDGIDEAVRQANEELARTGSTIRFLNAGLNTVCISSADDPEFIRLSARSI